MSNITKEDVVNLLRNVKDGDADVVSLGLVSSIVIRNGEVGLALQVDKDAVDQKESLRKVCEKHLMQLDGVEKVTAVLTASNASVEKEGAFDSKKRLPGVKRIVLVASGKGGVGKSTVTVQLTAALRDQGFKVGVVDADIYGPSIPCMLGVSGKPQTNDKKQMLPHNKDNIKSHSIGYLVDECTATVWRGPMATKALYQLFVGTEWGELDYLIVDMPPGTGDVQLTLAKQFAIDSVIMVSTPQDVALQDVRKAYDMFKKVGLPILGIIENMAYFDDPVSGNRSYIFGERGAERLAEELGINFIGQLPIDITLRESADRGEVVVHPNTKILVQCLVNVPTV